MFQLCFSFLTVANYCNHNKRLTYSLQVNDICPLEKALVWLKKQEEETTNYSQEQKERSIENLANVIQLCNFII